MIIRELQPLGFGRFSGEKFSLGNGIHIIYGDNESGKTTLQWFIVGMLYGFFQPGTKRKTYEAEHKKYQPWNTAAPYAGVMICEKDGVTYRIERVFQKDMDLVTVYDHTTGEDLTASFPYNPVTRLYEPGEVLTGVSKTIFCNTLRVAQGECPFQTGLSRAVQEQMAAMVQTGDGQYSLQRALDFLEKHREEVGSPKKSKSPYGAAIQKVQQLEEQFRNAQEEEEEYFILLQQEQETKKKLKRQEEEIAALELQQKQQKQWREKQRYLKVEQLQKECSALKEEQETLIAASKVSQEDMEEICRLQEKGVQAISFAEQYSCQEEQLWSDYQTLGFSTVQKELLEQFELYGEKYRQAAEKQAEVNQNRKKEVALKEGLSKMHSLNAEGLEKDIAQYQLWSRKEKAIYPFLCLILAAMLGAAGLALDQVPTALRYGLYGAAVLFTITMVVLVIKKYLGKATVEQEQRKILQKYNAKDMAQLTELLNKVELNNYKYQQFQLQLEDTVNQIQHGREEVYQLLHQIWSYVREITGEKNADPGVIVSQEMRERVTKGKELLGKIELLQGQKRQRGRSASKETQEKAETLLAHCQASSVEEIQEKQRRFHQIELQLQLNQKLLAEILEGTSLRELQTAAEDCTEAPIEMTENIKDIEAKMEEALEEKQILLRRLAQQEGQKNVMEKKFCPPGEIEKQIEEGKRECKEYQREVEAITLAKEHLEQASLKIQQDFAPALSREVSSYLPYLTSSKYDKILITPELGLRLVDKKSSRLVEVSQVSRGAEDILYLIVRICLGRLLSKENRPPLLLDDALAQIDQNRMEQMLRYLGSLSENQIILFTCHLREAEYLKNMDFPWSFTKLPV